MSSDRHRVVVVGDVGDACPSLTLDGIDTVTFLSFGRLDLMRSEIGGCESILLEPNCTVREREDTAWQWSTSLMEEIAGHEGMDADRALLIRRLMFARTFMPIFDASAMARRLLEAVGPDASIEGVAVTKAQATALSSVFAGYTGRGSSSGAATVTSAAGGAAGKSKLSRVIASTSRSIAQSVYRRRLMRQGPPLVAAFAQYPIHLDLVSGALGELANRGWRVALVDLSADGSLGRMRQDLPQVRFQQFYNDHTVLRTIGRLWYLRTRLLPVVNKWAARAGLTAFAGDIAAEVSRLYYVRSSASLAAHRAIRRRLPYTIALVLNEQSIDSECCGLAARRAGHGIVDLQHGVIWSTRLRAEFTLYDALCVFGEGYAEVLESMGTARDRIRVVGNPVAHAAVGCELPESNRDASGEGEINVLFCAQHGTLYLPDGLLYETLAMVLEAAEQDRRIRLTLKWHPLGEGKEEGYLAALREHPGVEVDCVRDGSLNDLIAAADVVTLHSSTVGFQAVSQCKPLILLQPRGEDGMSVFVSEGVALPAGDSMEFLREVKRIAVEYAADEERYERFSERYDFGRDGLASERIADVCEEVAKARQ